MMTLKDFLEEATLYGNGSHLAFLMARDGDTAPKNMLIPAHCRANIHNARRTVLRTIRVTEFRRHEPVPVASTPQGSWRRPAAIARRPESMLSPTRPRTSGDAGSDTTLRPIVAFRDSQREIDAATFDAVIGEARALADDRHVVTAVPSGLVPKNVHSAVVRWGNVIAGIDHGGFTVLQNRRLLTVRQAFPSPADGGRRLSHRA